VIFVGDQVRNAGTINAGQVALVAGDSATVALNNGQAVSVTVNRATTANAVLDEVINISGLIRAGTVVADSGGDTIVTGKIDASGATGGTVVLSGNRVGLFGNAEIDASGNNQGGLVIIGGDKLNKVPGSSAANLIQNVTFAEVTQIDSGVKRARIRRITGRQ
jgi:hypothetical protein